MTSSNGYWFFSDSDKGQFQSVELKDLQSNHVRIRAEYSSINYKDALAVSGRGKIFRSYPIVPGIDVAGTVMDSQSENFKTGDKVLVTGCGLGESFPGGYQEIVDVNELHVINLPLNFSTLDAMLIGTAGFTAGLALLRMEKLDQVPELGPILVTGASGGVGSLAVRLFSLKGYEVIAQSEKNAKKDYLHSLGAKTVVSLASLQLGDKPLESIRFGGAVDSLGGQVLSQTISHTNLYGNIASIGLASGTDINSTVMPHILRGVSIIGISSTNTPRRMREEVWSMLAKTLSVENLAQIEYKVIGLDEILETAEKFFTKSITGRIVVKIANSHTRT